MANVAFFSELYKKPVFDDKGRKVGSIKDLAFSDGEDIAEITHLVIGNGRKSLKVHWVFVSSLGKKIFLSDRRENIPCSEVTEEDSLVNETLMDRQLVDMNGLKVVRVNDVLLSKIQGRFFVAGVDVGTRGIARRLGAEKIFSLAMPKWPMNIIPWAFVQPLSSSPGQLNVKIAKAKINEVHPADLADLLDELSHSERQILFSALDEKTAAQALAEATPEIQKAIVQRLPERTIHSILKNLYPSQIVDLASRAPAVSKHRVLALMKLLDQRILKKIENITKYPEKSAAGIMRTEFFAIPDDYTVSKAISALRNQEGITMNYLYVTNPEKKLVGVVTIRELLLMKPHVKVKEFMDKKVIFVHINDSVKNVVRTFSKYHLFALPVIGEDEKIAGVVSMNDIFEEVVPRSWRKTPVIAERTKGFSA